MPPPLPRRRRSHPSCMDRQPFVGGTNKPSNWLLRICYGFAVNRVSPGSRAVASSADVLLRRARSLRGDSGVAVRHGLSELAANPRELLLTLGECGATH